MAVGRSGVGVYPGGVQIEEDRFHHSVQMLAQEASARHPTHVLAQARKDQRMHSAHVTHANLHSLVLVG